MHDIIQGTVDYFRSGKKSMWQWSADGEVLEFCVGGTITYREELMLLLPYFTEQGLPPLPSILYILYACLDAPEGIKKTPAGEILHNWTPVAGPRLTQLMQVIQGLPAEWRTGARKGLLLQEIFRDAKPVVPPDYTRAVLDEFSSGRLHARIVEPKAVVTVHDINTKMLHEAAKRFPTTKSLLLRLRTGLDTLPEEAPALVPELPADDLLRQLANDPKTEGIARLTERLVAALHITMHTETAGDLPLGGYADISTRGDLDRLLLSELAYDDALLTARLVNNEALYLRREEPPDRVHRQRVILLDTTLLLWGVPRVFAVSAALASTRNLPPHTTTHAVALGGETHTPLALSTPAGIVHALEQLDGALHCGAALQNVMRHGGFDDNADYVLITDEEAFQDPSVEAIYRTAYEQLQFLITVSRHGTLQFYALRNGRRKLLNSAHYDLDDILLSTPRKIPGTGIITHETLSSFSQTSPVPLYFPPVGLACTPDTAYHTYSEVFCVTRTKRLLYWHDRQHGATELLQGIGGNKYFFYPGEEGFLSLLALDTIDNKLRYYKFDLKLATHIHLELTEYTRETPIFIYASYMLFLGKYGLTGINCYHARLASDEELLGIPGIGPGIENLNNPTVIEQLLGRYQYNNRFVLKQMRRVTKVGAHVLQHVQSLAVTSLGNLLINRYALLVTENGTLRLLPSKDKHIGGSHFQATPGAPAAMTDNPQVQFFPFRWSFGGHGYGDTRGLLHLESGKTEIPSVTLVLTLDAPVACWSSDGHVCGAAYFIRDENLTQLPVGEFYEKYIKRFINDIIQYRQPSL
jgi:hypothetical protein